MEGGDSREYRSARAGLSVVRGEGPRRRGWRAAKRAARRAGIDRETHTQVVALDPARVAPEQYDFLMDLRRGRRRVYGGLLRYLDVAREAGAPKEALLLIPQWIESYVNDLFDDVPPTPVRRAA